MAERRSKGRYGDKKPTAKPERAVSVQRLSDDQYNLGLDLYLLSHAGSGKLDGNTVFLQDVSSKTYGYKGEASSLDSELASALSRQGIEHERKGDGYNVDAVKLKAFLLSDKVKELLDSMSEYEECAKDKDPTRGAPWGVVIVGEGERTALVSLKSTLRSVTSRPTGPGNAGDREGNKDHEGIKDHSPGGRE